MSNIIIQTENLSKSYIQGKFIIKVLENVNLEIHQRQKVFIIGPSGAGKTTLLNILGLMDNYDSGRYQLMGEDVAKLSPKEKNSIRKTHISFLFQNVPLLTELNVYENLILPSKIKDGKTDIAKEVKIVSEKLGISELFKRKITEISVGQRQRVALASAILKHPEILFCDEPTANLDNINTENILQLIHEINLDYGITVIFTTHNMSLAKYADKIYELSYGKLRLVK
ncbi:MAG: ABC transporter ATP-binding protein [Planctomycetota bacterium]